MAESLCWRRAWESEGEVWVFAQGGEIARRWVLWTTRGSPNGRLLTASEWAWAVGGNEGGERAVVNK